MSIGMKLLILALAAAVSLGVALLLVNSGTEAHSCCSAMHQAAETAPYSAVTQPAESAGNVKPDNANSEGGHGGHHH